MGKQGKKNKDRDDASLESNRPPKRPKTHEEDDVNQPGKGKEPEFKFFKEVFDGSKYFNMKKLNELNKDLSKRERVQNLKEKIYWVMHEGQYKDFKPEISFFQWVQDCKDLDDLNTLREIQKNNTLSGIAVKAGDIILRVILDIMFAMSMHKSKEMEAKFQVFEDVLKRVKTGEHSVVIVRILEHISAIKKILKTITEEAVGDARGKDVVAEEGQSNVDDRLKETFVDEFMHTLLGEIFKLELFWVTKRLPSNWDSLIKKIPSLQDEIRVRETQLMEVADDISTAIVYGAFGEIDKPWKSMEGYSDLKKLGFIL